MVAVAVGSLGGYALASSDSGAIPGRMSRRVVRLSVVRARLKAALRAANQRAGAAPGVPPQCPYKPIDPRSALPLPADALGPATQAALRYYRHSHEGVRAVGGVIAETATRQPPPARATARAWCGARIAHRTVTVTASLPERPGLNSSSLSFGIVLVSRFAHGYAVWADIH